jgi:hypothetical protein
MDNACPCDATGQHPSTSPITAISHPGLPSPFHSARGWFIGGIETGTSFLFDRRDS